MVKSVVLIGDCGVGKSFLVEKLTGVSGISSAASKAVTSCSLAYTTKDSLLRLYDVPGCNPEREKLFEHNLHVAQALGACNVNLLLLVVEAHCRIPHMFQQVEKYLDRFEELDINIGLVITKYDLVEKAWATDNTKMGERWTKGALQQQVTNDLGIDHVFVSDVNSGEALSREIHTASPEEGKKVDIDHESFLRIFKIAPTQRKVTSTVNREVKEFASIEQQFQELVAKHPAAEQKDMVFEFQQYMTQEISNIQARVTEQCQLDFLGPNAEEAVGHIANMTNRLRTVLHNLRVQGLKYQQQVGFDNGLRSCPHCGVIWNKVVGCDGATHCGQLVNEIQGHGTMANFSFSTQGSKLRVTKTGTRSVVARQAAKGFGTGCGKSITWSAMVPVQVPSELTAVTADATSTKDIAVVQQEILNTTWKQLYDATVGKLFRRHGA
jgi:GTP-binding protein EngB required for normal cell division